MGPLISKRATESLMHALIPRLDSIPLYQLHSAWSSSCASLSTNVWMVLLQVICVIYLRPILLLAHSAPRRQRCWWDRRRTPLTACVAGPRAWNELPLAVRQSDSVEIFKEELKTLYTSLSRLLNECLVNAIFPLRFLLRIWSILLCEPCPKEIKLLLYYVLIIIDTIMYNKVI